MIDLLEGQEEWKDIEGYEGLYKVSTLGHVASYDRLVRGTSGSLRGVKGRVLKERISKGYNYVALVDKDGNRKDMRVHCIVLKTFVGDAPIGYVCNHKNGVRNDNRIENLEWVTRADNIIHGMNVLGHMPGNRTTGINNKLSRKVIQKDLNGKFIREWPCMSDIERELGFRQGGISNACKTGGISRGYRWELI